MKYECMSKFNYVLTLAMKHHPFKVYINGKNYNIHTSIKLNVKSSFPDCQSSLIKMIVRILYDYCLYASHVTSISLCPKALKFTSYDHLK